MKEITRTKKLEVAHYYLLGYTYREIEEETGVSHGSIANIVSEIENSSLTISGTAFDQVNDLRQLSSDLSKSGLKPSQALLGITFLRRLQSLQITLEDLEAWSELVKKLLPPDFSAKEFFEAGQYGSGIWGEQMVRFTWKENISRTGGNDFSTGYLDNPGQLL